MAKIKGTKGNDRIDQDGRPGLEIRALGGNDTIVLDRDDDLGGDNFVDAGAGKDTVFSAFEGGNTILLGKGNDTYVGTGFSSLGGLDGVDGGAGNDQFFLKTFKSAYHGGNGQDIFHSDGWQNNINGGNGIDTISYAFRHEDSVAGDSGVTIDLAAGAAQTGASRFETLTSIENAIGSELGDIIGGTDGTNVLMGLGGNDEIFGFGGDDMLIGGAGSDLLVGGTGRDTFVYQTLSDSTLDLPDEILDFNRAEGDRIDLSAVDAVPGQGGKQAFRFVDDGRFTGTAGELIFGEGALAGDIDGDGAVDFVIHMGATRDMQASDFIL